MIHPPFSRSALAGALLVLCVPAWSQPAAPVAAPEASLREVTVTGNPLERPDAGVPVHSLNLNARPQDTRTTLGDTLDGLPGVSATYFGPNANRPVIRGLDGDRIRILNNSGTALDASALSYDHAVPLDPLVAERLEVLRGPAALLYGGSATGGVVNVLDNRIPQEPQDGVSGKADLGLASGNRERGGAALLEAGNGRVVVHVDAFDRRTGDVRAPLDLPCDQGGVVTTARRLCNSASHSRGGAVGASVFFDRGFIGLSVDEYRSTYGTVAEDEVTVGMHSSRAVLAGEWRSPGALIERVRGQWSHNGYRHTEFDAGAAGTLFSNRGNALRLEARHRAFGPVQGVIGLQAEGSDFSADGAEAFAPFSATRSRALFVHEELRTGWGVLSLGARGESVRVTSLGNPDPSVTRFAVGERRFSPGSLALGLERPLASGWQFTTNLARTRRAPRDYELFANGPHVATAAWETGDPALGLETSTSLDLGLAWRSGPNRFSANLYHSRFGRYIGLLDTGATRGADGETNPLDADGDGLADGSGEAVLPEQAYRGVRARFSGIEASGTVRLRGAPATGPRDAGGVLDLLWRLDRVQATNRDTGEPLPRIAPARLGATLAWSDGPWSARLGFDHLAAQNRVPATSRATAAYTLWNAGISWRQKRPAASLTWYARVDNLTDRLAWSATSVLTTTAFPKAPLPGRSLKLGLQALF
jgi:iron complex outermembrane receptor protein